MKFKDGISFERISEILSAEGASMLRELKPEGLYLIRLKKDQDVKDAMEIFATYEEVEYAEPNYMLKIQ